MLHSIETCSNLSHTGIILNRDYSDRFRNPWASERVTKSTHTPEYQRLIAILTDARRKAGLTQQQVADRLGKPQSYVAKVEGAERRIDVVEFVALAKAMGQEPAALFQTVLVEVGKP